MADAYAYWKENADEKQLRKAVQPMEAGLAHLSKLILSDNAINSVAHGAQLAVPGVLSLSSEIKRGDSVAVFSQKSEGVMLGTALMDSEEILDAKKGIAIKTERVLIEPDAYPRPAH